MISEPVQTDELFRQAPYEKGCKARVIAHDPETGGLILDRTVFYPEGGGQPGDCGTLSWNGAIITISTTNRTKESGQIVHIPIETIGTLLPPVGQEVEITLDWERRHRHMRMHTCLHVLCGLIDGAVTGGSIGADKGRLDFDLPDPPDKDTLNEALKAAIAANYPVTSGWITDEELDANPDLVRTLSVAPPRGQGRVRVIRVGESLDFQPCGGTHVTSTGEIGAVRIAKIEKKGRQNRRVSVVFED